MAKSSSPSAGIVLLILVAVSHVPPSSGSTRPFQPSRHLLQNEQCVDSPPSATPLGCNSNADCCRTDTYIPSRTSIDPKTYDWLYMRVDGNCIAPGRCCAPYGAYCNKDSDCCPGYQTVYTCVEGGPLKRYCGNKDY